MAEYTALTNLEMALFDEFELRCVEFTELMLKDRAKAAVSAA